MHLWQYIWCKNIDSANANYEEDIYELGDSSLDFSNIANTIISQLVNNIIDSFKTFDEFCRKLFAEGGTALWIILITSEIA